MRKTKRTLRALMVLFIGLWALKATEAQASPDDKCDEVYCLPDTTCNEQQVELWCRNACPTAVWGICGTVSGECEGEDHAFYCSTAPE